MDARFEVRIESGSGSTSDRYLAVPHGTCPRCRGLMVGEFCMDLLNGVGGLEVLASRCVLCGEVVDPVILENRRIQRASPTGRPSRPKAPAHQESIRRRRTS